MHNPRQPKIDRLSSIHQALKAELAVASTNHSIMSDKATIIKHELDELDKRLQGSSRQMNRLRILLNTLDEIIVQEEAEPIPVYDEEAMNALLYTEVLEGWVEVYEEPEECS